MTAPTPIPILLYHSLSVEATPRYRHFAMEPRVFAEQMEIVAAGGHSVLSVGEFVAALGEPAEKMPARPVVLTFDDGFSDTFEVAAPIVERHRFHASLYVVTGSLGRCSGWLEQDGEGSRRLMTPAQVRDLDAAGIEIGAHGHQHVPLDEIPFAEATRQIDVSRLSLEDIVGHSITTFAYPYGYHTNRIKSYLQASGFTSACAVKQALSHRGDDHFSLARIIVGSDTPRHQFEGWLRGEGLPVGRRHGWAQTTAWRLARRLSHARAGHGPRNVADD